MHVGPRFPRAKLLIRPFSDYNPCLLQLSPTGQVRPARPMPAYPGAVTRPSLFLAHNTQREFWLGPFPAPWAGVWELWLPASGEGIRPESAHHARRCKFSVAGSMVLARDELYAGNSGGTRPGVGYCRWDGGLQACCSQAFAATEHASHRGISPPRRSDLHAANRPGRAPLLSDSQISPRRFKIEDTITCDPCTTLVRHHIHWTP